LVATGEEDLTKSWNVCTKQFRLHTSLTLLDGGILNMFGVGFPNPKKKPSGMRLASGEAHVPG